MRAVSWSSRAAAKEERWESMRIGAGDCGRTKAWVPRAGTMEAEGFWEEAVWMEIFSGSGWEYFPGVVLFLMFGCALDVLQLVAGLESRVRLGG